MQNTYHYLAKFVKMRSITGIVSITDSTMYSESMILLVHLLVVIQYRDGCRYIYDNCSFSVPDVRLLEGQTPPIYSVYVCDIHISTRNGNLLSFL